MTRDSTSSHVLVPTSGRPTRELVFKMFAVVALYGAKDAPKIAQTIHHRRIIEPTMNAFERQLVSCSRRTRPTDTLERTRWLSPQVDRRSRLVARRSRCGPDRCDSLNSASPV